MKVRELRLQLCGADLEGRIQWLQSSNSESNNVNVVKKAEVERKSESEGSSVRSHSLSRSAQDWKILALIVIPLDLTTQKSVRRHSLGVRSAILRSQGTNQQTLSHIEGVRRVRLRISYEHQWDRLPCTYGFMDRPVGRHPRQTCQGEQPAVCSASHCCPSYKLNRRASPAL